MITQNEISSLNLSPTNKDFVQIWNELIEVASKITERWDPTSTNESDPGIVLLKVLAGIADKLNYNIDKNILEAYMPTAAQMESMRKLCEIVGYDIKYYQSATTKVKISYTGNTENNTENDERLPTGDLTLALPKFTTITNADKDISFITVNKIPALFTNDTPSVIVDCIEGQICKCESINEHNLITLEQFDANNRYYLPEVQIAENGIFVYNASESMTEGTQWEQVSNLNTWPLENRIFKFGYDSFAGRPYLAFPDDVGNLIGDGLFIYFTRTSGLNGNIKAMTLNVLELPSSDWGDWENYSAEQFEVINEDATSNGANIESISAAYNNFKKTVGTFDTLVTCRDYMNKIYSLMNANNLPYVSNILVTDIRNDINNAITLCSCNESGILYKELPLTKTIPVISSITAEDVDKDGIYKLTVTNESSRVIEEPYIDHFDLLLYPFKTFTQVSPGLKDLVGPYNKSFTYTEQRNSEIETALADFKTCAHNLVTPKKGDIVAINNYLRLDAHIATSTRISEIEANDILKNVRVALVNAFNLRNLDFGEEIPFDSILSVMENADPRIKVVSLQEPTLLTTYSVKEGVDHNATSKEYGIASTVADRIKGVNYTYKDETTGEEKEYTTAKEIYNKLVLRNILAGRASLLDYDETFITNNFEKPYTVTQDISITLEALEKVTKNTDGNLVLDSLKEEEKQALTELIKNLVSENIIDPDIINKELSERLDELKIKAEAINTVINGVTEASLPRILYSDGGAPLKGLYDGITTLEVTETEDPTTGQPIKKSKVYETFEPGFDAKSATSDSPNSFEKVKDEVIDNIAKVDATCELTNTSEVFQNVTLGKNEVIKFRAPNLITTTTYPAYVYYRFEKAEDTTANQKNSSNTATYARTTRATAFTGTASSSTSDDGSYANVMSLASFINAYASDNGTATDTELPKRLKSFFNDLWKAAANNTSVGLKTFKWVPPKEDEDDPESSGIAQSSVFQNIFNIAIAVGTNEDDEIDINNTKKVFTDLTELNKYLKDKANDKKSIMFKYYPFWDSTMPVWSEYVREKYEELYGEELPEGTTFWRLSTTSGHPKGKYVTESGQRLLAQGGDFLQNTVVGATTYICKILGVAPTYASFPSGSDLELRPGNSAKSGDNKASAGDRLYIHYTPSSINEDGETVTAEPISIVYESTIDKPIIIKPSGFTLMPSGDLHNSQGVSWKKTGVKFTLKDGSSVYRDLLALAPNEQIEIRKISEVVLDTPARFYKNFKEEILESGDPNSYPDGKSSYSYELKDGEYIFYTDQNASNAAYYGSGSVITISGGAQIPESSESIEVSQILEEGLHIVPWSRVELLGGDKKVKITEYRYETLVEGDTLNSLTLKEGTSIGNEWEECLNDTQNPIVYTPADSETAITLPKISLSSANSASWEVRSILELSTSPGYAQPLRAAQISTGKGPIKIKDAIKLHVKNDTGTAKIIEVTPQKSTNPVDPDKSDFYEPVSIKLDIVAQAASGEVEKEIKETSKDNTLMRAKVFKEETPSIVEFKADQEITPVSNPVQSPADSKNNITEINNYWTTLDIKNALINSDKEEAKALKLNFLVPTEKTLDLFGIFSIYFSTSIDNLTSDSKQNIPKKGTRVYIDIPKEFGPYKDVIDIYNIHNYKKFEDHAEYSWWSEGISEKVDPDTADDGIVKKSNRLYLRAGLNCIRIKKSCNILIGAENEAAGSLVYDNFRLVKGRKTYGINLDLLDYKAITESSEEELSKTILQEIAKLDKNHDFYYNVPIENSLAIEFDNSIKSFSNPYTLYDVNNVNNSFVISKLDVAYLGDESTPGGLRIAKSSRY